MATPFVLTINLYTILLNIHFCSVTDKSKNGSLKFFKSKKALFKSIILVDLSFFSMLQHSISLAIICCSSSSSFSFFAKFNYFSAILKQKIYYFTLCFCSSATLYLFRGGAKSLQNDKNSI